MTAPTVFTDDHGFSFAKVLGIVRASGEPAVYVPQHLWSVQGEHRNPNEVLVIMTGTQLAQLEEKFRARTAALLAVQEKYRVPVVLK